MLNAPWLWKEEVEEVDLCGIQRIRNEVGYLLARV